MKTPSSEAHGVYALSRQAVDTLNKLILTDAAATKSHQNSGDVLLIDEQPWNGRKHIQIPRWVPMPMGKRI